MRTATGHYKGASWLVAGVAAFAVWLVLAAAPAQAGNWMHVSCVNPDGSAAPAEGWSGFATGNPGYFSITNTNCAPGTPMLALLSSAQAVSANSGEYLQYTPPAGSTLIGGRAGITFHADGSGGFDNAIAALQEPTIAHGDVFYRCVGAFRVCGTTVGSSDVTTTVPLPSDRGGNLYVSAFCDGAAGTQCDRGGSQGAWARAQLSSADLLLSSSAAPQGTNFSGSALQRDANGTVHIVFTASDPGGPGVYRVAVGVGGRLVWAGTPNDNGGRCVPVGTDPGSGALMFDFQQPCPPTVVVDAPVPTRGLPDGRHQLTVAVIDAAQNVSPVLDQKITSFNPQHTPVPRSRHSVRAQFVISWSWAGRTTRLRSISVHDLPRRATVRVSCSGRRCPRLAAAAVHGDAVRRLLSALAGARFRAGDRLLITVTAPRRRRERIQLTIRDNRLPRARLLR